MKLATYDDGSRDGQLVVVSRDLTMAQYATGVATRLQQVLDDWNFLAPQLEELSITLNQGRARHAFSFEPQRCKAPLPRAFHWVDHEEQGVHVRPGDAIRSWFDPVGACVDAGVAPHPLIGMAAVTGDVAAGVGPAEAIDAVRLLMLVQAWALAPGPAGEPLPTDDAATASPAARPVPCCLAVRCAPVAVTPDELGEAWRSGVAQLALVSGPAGGSAGRRIPARAAPAVLRWPAPRHFGTLAARAAAAVPVAAGSVMAWYRSVEMPVAPGVAPLLEAVDADGRSVFGPLACLARSAPGDAATVPPQPLADGEPTTV